MSRRADRPLVFAHRGGDVGRANSLDAIRSAAEHGVDGVEIDVQLADDQLIARHDLGDPGSDAAFDTLADVLTLTDELDLRLLIDFKSAGPDALQAEVDALVAALPAPGQGPRLSVSAFSVPFLNRLAEFRPDLERHAIISLRQNFWGKLDFDVACGVSVLAMALVVRPLLAWRTTRASGRLLVWFGATEWPFVIRLATRMGADALIVRRLPASD